MLQVGNGLSTSARRFVTHFAGRPARPAWKHLVRARGLMRLGHLPWGAGAMSGSAAHARDRHHARAIRPPMRRSKCDRGSWHGREQLLFDPDSYNKGTNTAIKLYVPSLDGKSVLLGLAAKGGEWSELRVLRVDEGQLLPDSVSD
jgi:hypothetical protein